MRVFALLTICIDIARDKKITDGTAFFSFRENIYKKEISTSTYPSITSLHEVAKLLREKEDLATQFSLPHKSMSNDLSNL